jgi:predicted RNase H-like HicB family nuclease
MNRNTHHDRHEYVAAGAWDFSCRFRRDVGGGYRVTSSEVPDMLTFGDTLAAARENAREELVICLGSSDFLDDPFRDPRIERRSDADH